MARRRRRSTPTPAQIWRILHAIARQAEAWEKRERAREERERAREERERAREERERAREERDRREAKARERREAKRNEAQERRLERMFQRYSGESDNRWGRLAEDLVNEDLLDVLRDADIGVVRVFPRVKAQIDRVWHEYDMVAVGEHDAVVVEVKATLTPSDVTQFTKRLRRFREWRPDLARERVRGAMAYLAVEGTAAWTAESAGFHLIRVLDSTARMANSERFQPAFY